MSQYYDLAGNHGTFIYKPCTYTFVKICSQDTLCISKAQYEGIKITMYVTTA